MANCKYCTNYYLNCNNSVDNSCMGLNDIRKPFYQCNEKLNPNYDDTQDMIAELRKQGYKIAKQNTKETCKNEEVYGKEFKEIADWICEYGMSNTSCGQYYVDFETIAEQFDKTSEWVKRNVSEIEKYLHSFLDYEIEPDSFDMNFEGEECCKRCGGYEERCYENCIGCDLWFEEYGHKPTGKPKLNVGDIVRYEHCYFETYYHLYTVVDVNEEEGRGYYYTISNNPSGCYEQYEHESYICLAEDESAINKYKEWLAKEGEMIHESMD